MAKTLNVLSIDFSYYQNIQKDTLNKYPEGKDVSSDMTEMIWSSYYAKNESSLREITTNRGEIDKTITYLKTCNKNIPVMISANHSPIYEFLCNQMHDTNSIKLHLIHIDMYHDMFNDNYELDNGNWIKFISEDFDTFTEWITNPVSKSLYGLDSPKFTNIRTSIPSNPNELLDPTTINAIFLCKNNALLPPHLDPDFKKLTDYIENTYTNVTVLKQADKIRDIGELVKQKRELLTK